MTSNDNTINLTVASIQRTPAADLNALARQLKMLVLDVDGVLSDGGIWYSESGDELKRFHVRDGSGIKLWQGQGLKVSIISGRNSAPVTRRAKELGIDPVLQGRSEKAPALVELLERTSVSASEICVVGDDLPDLPLMQRAGLCAAVADAATEVRAAANYITTARGGHGAVREVIEWLLKLRGEWAAALSQFRNP